MLKFYAYLQTLRRDDKGAAAAEYALILALIGSVIAIAATNLGTAVAGAIQKAADTINAGA